MAEFKKVFGRVQFYNRPSEYFENLDQLMEILYQKDTEKGLAEFIVIYGNTADGKLYRSVFDFNSFSLEDIALDELQLGYKKFQKYLGELLVEQRIVDRKQIERALYEQDKSNFNERLGEILVRMGFAKAEDIFRALGEQLGLKVED